MKKRVIVIGDLHNQWHLIPTHIRNYDIDNAYYIHVGDFPMGFHEDDEKRIKELNKVLKETNNHLLLVRGNHDDPDWYKHDNHRETKDLLTNITFVQDYDTMLINDEKWLFVGGAISLDRKRRIREDDNWFMDEKFVLDENKIKDIFDVKWVITHTAPMFCAPQGVGGLVFEFAKTDMHLLEDCKFERDQLTKFHDLLVDNNPMIKGWFYGHFHHNATTDVNGLKFNCLGIGVFAEVTRHDIE